MKKSEIMTKGFHNKMMHQSDKVDKVTDTATDKVNNQTNSKKGEGITMNNKMNNTMKRYLVTMLKGTRKRMGFTQEAMAEELNISTRAYNNLECGRCGVSANTLLYFMLTMNDETLLEFIKKSRDYINWEEDEEESAQQKR